MSSVPKPSLIIETDECDRLLSDLKELPSVALAVSGGPDSLALLQIYNSWRLRHAQSQQCLVLTVNHGLRPEAKDESLGVSKICSSLELEHKILHWTGPKPKSNLPAIAREARYDLMAESMREHGIEHLVLAHHLDDQAETFLNRLIRGSGVYGLGSMAPKTMLGDITLHRPLLEIPKQRLIATLEAAGWEWFEDPSNDSNKQMRGRLRKIMPLFSNEGLTVKRIASTAKRMRRTADALNHAVEQLRNVALTKHSSGPVRLELEPIGNAPEEIALRLISYVISEMGGKSYVARLNRVENLYQNLFNSNTEEFNGSTIGGTIVLVSKSRPDVIWIAREFGRGIKSLSLAAGQKSIWDDRFEIELTKNAPENVKVSQLFDKREQLNGIVNYPDGWPKRAFYSSPVISWSGKMRENSIQPEATCEFFVQGFGHEVPDWLKLRSVNKWLVDLN